MVLDGVLKLLFELVGGGVVPLLLSMCLCMGIEVILAVLKLVGMADE